MKDEQEVDLFFEKNRLKTFKNSWPFSSTSPLSKEKMAAAGFHFTGKRTEPDLVQCFVCFKELDGWEEEDDPWVEHGRNKECLFVRLNKTEKEMTALDLLDLVMERMTNKMKKNMMTKINDFQELAVSYQKKLEG